MTTFTMESDMKVIREAARTAGIKWVGVTKEALVNQLNAQQYEEAIKMQEITETSNVEQSAAQEQVVETSEVKVSRHFNHPNCQELVMMLTVLDIKTATVTRGTKNPKETLLITEKEQELVETFISTGYNIKKTGEVLGFSHTNVWQRLYGTPQKKDKPAKGILGKLREYVASQTQVEVTEEEAV